MIASDITVSCSIRETRLFTVIKIRIEIADDVSNSLVVETGLSEGSISNTISNDGV